MASQFRLPRPRSLLEVLTLLGVIALFYHLLDIFTRKHDQAPWLADANGATKPHACSQLEGASDVVVVLKTSAAELAERLPYHFDTTMSCYPNHLVFSDWKETYKGHTVLDALESVSPDIKSSNSDFELWRRLQIGGPDALEDEETWEPEETTKYLDKWKWLPMIDRTFSAYPDKKWYVFLETETYLFWTNLLAWISGVDPLDHTQPYYIGALKQVAGITFARAGAGIVLSQAAMRMLTSNIRSNKETWDEYTGSHWTGDSILGKALSDSGVSLTEAWPAFQEKRPAIIDYSSPAHNRKLWCYPTISYDGVSPPNIAEMWKFEQEWTKEHPGRILRHKHIFKDFIMPRLTIRSGRVDDWDNFSGNFEEGTPAESVDHCRDQCVNDIECVQFSYALGKCEFSNVPKMGDYKRGVSSRWILPRAQRLAEQLEPCQGDEWWTQE